jgi:hypothetical protein
MLVGTASEKYCASQPAQDEQSTKSGGSFHRLLNGVEEKRTGGRNARRSMTVADAVGLASVL